MNSFASSSSTDTKPVSKTYFSACAMMHDAVDRLYESMHDSDGNPLLDEELVLDLTNSFKKEMRLEVDMIKSALRQHLEIDAD